MDKPPLHYQTIADLADGVRKGGITSTQLVQNFLDRIKSMDGQLNAFRLRCPEHALEQAAAADSLLGIVPSGRQDLALSYLRGRVALSRGRAEEAVDLLRSVRANAPETFDTVQIDLTGVFAIHPFEHPVRSGLHRQMNVRTQFIQLPERGHEIFGQVLGMRGREPKWSSATARPFESSVGN